MRKLILLVLVAMFFLTAGASAGTLTYTDVSCINSGSTVCSSSIYVYYQDGTLAGSLNGTNDAITYNESQAINIYLKPNSISLLNNPAFFFQWLMNTWQMFFVIILMIGVVVGFLYLVRKLFMPSNSVVTPKPKRRWG